jgi:alpha-mannosidase
MTRWLSLQRRMKLGWPEARYVGELYLQVHRGTYTSQARTKALNRRCEFALREVELWGSVAMVLKGYEFPYSRWDAAWKTVLLNQFHDILPGSSIAKVYEEAEAQLSGVLDGSAEMMAEIGHSLVDQKDGMTVFNSLSWPRVELIELPPDTAGLISDHGESVPIQTTRGKTFAEVSLPACGWESFNPGKSHLPKNTCQVQKDTLENDLMKVMFNDFGEITRIFDKLSQSEVTAGVCNQLRMYQDIPSAFDAWDIDSMYRQSPVELVEPAEIEILGEGPLFASLVVRRKLNNSSMTQTITLRRDTRRMDFHTVIDWQERHKLLKVNFPVNYFAHEALHEIQFGHLARPTHRSRELDRDRFEVCNQKWSALVEGERGFAILNDSKYGVDVLDNSINLTLLKAALAPDMTADHGRQSFSYAFYFWNGSIHRVRFGSGGLPIKCRSPGD